MTQQMMRADRGEATERAMVYGSAQPLTVDLYGSRETQARKKQHRPLDAHPARWVATHQVLHRTDTPGKYQHKEGGKGLKKIQQADIWQFLRFCIVGTSNAVIDFGVLNLLLWLYPTADVWKTLGYNSLAVLLAATNSFFWNKYWTFQQHSPITFQEVYRFLVVASGTTLMNDTLMGLLDRAFPGMMGNNLLGANALKLGAIIGTMSISFFGMRLWVFFQKRLVGEARSLADDETKKRPATQLVYDVDTVMIAALRPVYDVDTTVLRAPDKPRLNVLTPDQGFSQKVRKTHVG
jgi:putative flippase GtrA